MNLDRLHRYTKHSYEEVRADIEAVMIHAQNVGTLLEELAQIVATARSEGAPPPANTWILRAGLADMEQRLAGLVEQFAANSGLSAA